jgi:hypothetical protein
MCLFIVIRVFVFICMKKVWFLCAKIRLFDLDDGFWFIIMIIIVYSEMMGVGLGSSAHSSLEGSTLLINHRNIYIICL